MLMTDEKCIEYVEREPNRIQHKSVSQAQLLIPGNDIWTVLTLAFGLPLSQRHTL